MSSIHIIVAMTRKRIIGNGGHLPWKLPEDLRLFRQLTIGKVVLMGRTTFQSIGHPLPQRHNIIISSSMREAGGGEVCRTFADGLVQAKKLDTDIYCIGGAEIYRQALRHAETLHISWVDADIAGDCFFPEFDLDDWIETGRQHYPGFVHCTYQRKNSNTP